MIANQISETISRAIHDAFGLEDIKPEISYPDPSFGDFATNVSFSLAKQLKRSPQEIASELASRINGDQFEEVSAAGGFVNLRMSHKFWIEQLHQIGGRYGGGEATGKQVQVEFISANPTGPLTLGNARGGYVGDVIGKVLAHLGHQITNEYYFNDAGTQIRTLVNSVKAAAGIIPPADEYYPGDYIDQLAKEFKDDLHTRSDSDLARVLTTAILERWIRPAIDKMGIHYDQWFNESVLVSNGDFDRLLVDLKDLNLLEEREGAVWLKSTAIGDERDRVLRKSNGDVTYLGTDLAYHRNIFEERGFDVAIKVWGADHAGQVPSLRLAMDKLTPGKQLDFVLLQWVRLMRDGQEVKMSKRAGTYVTVEELIAEVGSDVARFFFLMRSTDTAMDFDLDLAKEQSQKNPLFYVMYSYARAHSILRKAADSGLAPVSSLVDLSEEEAALIRHLSRFPALLREIEADYGVHRLTFFGMEVAKLFHDLYEKERIIDLDKMVASRRLYVIERYTQFMRLYFGLLGIVPQERMEHQPA